MNKVRAAYKRSLAKDEDRMKTAMSSSKCSMWGGIFLKKILPLNPLKISPYLENVKKT
jgi:hypothetical protein